MTAARRRSSHRQSNHGRSHGYVAKFSEQLTGVLPGCHDSDRVGQRLGLRVSAARPGGRRAAIVFLNHLAGVLDNWDPRVVDGLAAQRRVITFDNRGVGASAGSTPDTIEAMANDAVAFIRALGLDHVDLLGLSMGGFVAQVIAQQEPRLIRRIILAGTGPAGGEGIDKVTRLMLQDIAKGALTLQDPKQFTFFTRTANGQQAGRDLLRRLKERKHDRDKAISLQAFRAQLKPSTAGAAKRPPTSRPFPTQSWWRTGTATG